MAVRFDIQEPSSIFLILGNSFTFWIEVGRALLIVKKPDRDRSGVTREERNCGREAIRNPPAYEAGGQ